MRLHLGSACMCLTVLMAFAAAAQEPQATLFISCDTNCTWKVDGVDFGLWKKGEEGRLAVPVGKHEIEAKSSGGKPWKRTVNVTEPKDVQIQILFSRPSTPADTKPAIAATSDSGVQTSGPAFEAYRFSTESRQVLVGATVWDPTHGKKLTDHPTPVRGLAAGDFHVFENGVARQVNYLAETDFPEVDGPFWNFAVRTRGTWGYAPLPGGAVLRFASATYLIGYVPPALQPGECRAIKVLVEGHYVDVNRDHYCNRKKDDAIDETMVEGTSLGKQMREFARSTAHGSIKVSSKAFAFRSSLQLASWPSKTSAPDFRHLIDVQDSNAPARVQVATEFSWVRRWDYPGCLDSHDALYVLGLIYQTNGRLAAQFGDSLTCVGYPTLVKQLRENITGLCVPNRFDSEIALPPGEYDVRVVVSDGRHSFGKAQTSLRVGTFDGQRLAISDLALSSISRSASWLAFDIPVIFPEPLVPTPLVSQGTQYFPSADMHWRKSAQASLYFEIYEPLLEKQDVAVSFRLRISDLRTGSLVVDTGAVSTSKWVLPGNAVIPIGTKLATDTLKKGSYRLEVQAFDSAGRETEWRQATFEIVNVPESADVPRYREPMEPPALYPP
jgi:hypothetical protein